MTITTFDRAGLSAPVPALGSTVGCVVPVVVPCVAAEIVEGFNWSAAACAEPDDCPAGLALPWFAALTTAPSADPCRFASIEPAGPVPMAMFAVCVLF